MKKKLFLGMIVLFLIVICIPFKIITYKDGGTKEFQALLYKYVSWNTMMNTDEIYQKKEIFWFPNNFKNINELEKDLGEELKKDTITKEASDKGKSVIDEQLTFDEEEKHINNTEQENISKNKEIVFPKNDNITEEMRELVAELQTKYPHIEKEDIEREVKNYYIMSFQEESRQAYLQNALEKYEKKDNQFGIYTAFGIEPFWSLEVDENSAKYSAPETYDEVTGKEKMISYQIKIIKKGKNFLFEGENIKGNFTKQDCVTPKGDFIAYTVKFEKDGREYSGCGELKGKNIIK